MDANCEDIEAIVVVNELEISSLVWRFVRRRAERTSVDPRQLIADVVAAWVVEQLEV